MIKENLKSREIGIDKNQVISEKLARKSRVLLALGANLNSKFGNRIETLEIAQTYLINNGISRATTNLTYTINFIFFLFGHQFHHEGITFCRCCIYLYL